MQIRAIAGVALFISFPLAPLTRSQSKRPVAIDDIYRTQQIANPQCSPDGKWVAYTLTINDREADKRRASIWMVNRDGTHDVQLTSGTEDAGSPRWSPDGNFSHFSPHALRAPKNKSGYSIDRAAKRAS
ncbi:MAG TPA: hypothetical protein VHT31_09920 [Candidatus Acidoferrum sp.]|nr:hypothetical protein [Candidatus Acidoferrum sp.]